MYRRIGIMGILLVGLSACVTGHKVQCFRDAKDIHYSEDGTRDLNIGSCLSIRGSTAVFKFKSYFN